MITVRCKAIVHRGDSVLLVKDAGASAVWRLPTRQLDESGDFVGVITRCVLEETGFMPTNVRFFRVVYEAKNRSANPTMCFIFGCEIGAAPEKTGKLASRSVSPEGVLQLANNGECKDTALIRLIYDYKFKTRQPSDAAIFPYL